MVENFSEWKAEKEGKLTPKVLIENLLQAIDEGIVQEVAFVTRCQDGEIKTGWSEMNLITGIGLLELGKQAIMAEMYEEED
jgi:hypothetical protein